MPKSAKSILSCLMLVLMLIHSFTNAKFAGAKLSDVRTSSIHSDLPNFKPAFALSQKIIKLVNDFRAKHGLKAFTWDRRLTNLSRGHSVNMGLNGVPFGHAGFDNRVKNFSSPAKAAGENIFMGSITGDVARVIVNSWINSPEYRKNLLGNFNISGVGLYKSALGVWFVTQLVGLIN